MRQKYLYALGILTVLIIIAASYAVFAMKNNSAEAGPQQETAAAKTNKSQFSFAGAAGWRQGPSNETSMALFSDNNSCFTSIQYIPGTVDVAAELKKSREITIGDDDYTVTSAGTRELAVQVAGGQQQYELHQSAVTTPAGSVKVKGGQEFGFLQLSDGYLKVEGYCDTADQLQATLAALQAIKFDKAD